MPVFREDFERCLLDLNLDPSEQPDRNAVRRAYAKLAKTIRPDDNPSGFQQLRQNYELALLGFDEGFYDDYERDVDSDFYAQSDANNQQGDVTDRPTMPSIDIDDIPLSASDGLVRRARNFNQAPSNSENTAVNQNSIQSLQDQMVDQLSKPVEQADSLMRFTDQLLAHLDKASLQVAFETKQWLLSLAAWNEHAPLSWLHQLNAHFDLENSANDYGQQFDASAAAVNRIVAKLASSSEWANLEREAVRNPSSAANFLLNQDKWLPLLWVQSFWRSFNPNFREAVNSLLRWIATQELMGHRGRTSVDVTFERRWDFIQQFAAIGQLKTIICATVSGALLTTLVSLVWTPPFSNLVLYIPLALASTAALLWIGGEGMARIRHKLSPYAKRLDRLELCLGTLLSLLLPLYVSIQFDQPKSTLFSSTVLSENGSLFVLIVFCIAMTGKLVIDVITGQYTLIFKAGAEMLLGLGLIFGIVAWQISLGSGFDFDLATAGVAWFVFLASLPTAVIQRVGHDYFTWRSGDALRLTPKRAVVGLIVLLLIHIVVTQLVSNQLVVKLPNLDPTVQVQNHDFARVWLGAASVLLCYLSILAAGNAVLSHQIYIIFSFLAIGASWSFIATVSNTMPLVRFQIMDVYVMVNLLFSLVEIHKSQTEKREQTL